MRDFNIPKKIWTKYCVPETAGCLSFKVIETQALLKARRGAELFVFYPPISGRILNFELNVKRFGVNIVLWTLPAMSSARKMLPKMSKRLQACAKTPQTRITIAGETSKTGLTVSHSCFWGNPPLFTEDKKDHRNSFLWTIAAEKLRHSPIASKKRLKNFFGQKMCFPGTRRHQLFICQVLLLSRHPCFSPCFPPRLLPPPAWFFIYFLEWLGEMHWSLRQLLRQSKCYFDCANVAGHRIHSSQTKTVAFHLCICICRHSGQGAGL